MLSTTPCRLLFLELSGVSIPSETVGVVSGGVGVGSDGMGVVSGGVVVVSIAAVACNKATINATNYCNTYLFWF